MRRLAAWLAGVQALRVPRYPPTPMTATSVVRVALCADGFGRSVPSGAAIVDLAVRRRLQAVACRTTAPGWPACAALLQPQLAVVEAGLQLNLTDGVPSSPALAAVWPVFPTWRRLVTLAHAGRLPLPQIAAELAAQWAAFEAHLGRAPDFVAGHRHVHHLPGVRRQVLSAVLRAGTPLAVRNTGRVVGPGMVWARQCVERTGGRALQAALRVGGVPHNAALMGLCDPADPDYRSRVRGWLAQVTGEGAMLVCHPGVDEGGGAIGAAADRQRRYLAGRDFAQDLADARTEPGPVWRIVNPPSRPTA